MNYASVPIQNPDQGKLTSFRRVRISDPRCIGLVCYQILTVLEPFYVSRTFNFDFRWPQQRESLKHWSCQPLGQPGSLQEEACRTSLQRLTICIIIIVDSVRLNFSLLTSHSLFKTTFSQHLGSHCHSDLQLPFTQRQEKTNKNKSFKSVNKIVQIKKLGG